MATLRNVFLELNTDVLPQIFEYLWPDGGLRSLSMTSWSMREATVPLLFSHCKVIVTAPLSTAHFVPRSLWPYVKSLYLIDRCPDLVAMRDSLSELEFACDPLVCGVMCATFLRDTLRAMPVLRSVSLEIRALEVHGVGWDLLAAILSTPQLRSFMIRTFLFSPRQAPPETWVDTLAPINTFRYQQPPFRSRLRTYLVQKDSLAFVLSRLHHFLETLLLPSEITPVTVLAHTQWPQLRELILDGDSNPSAGHKAPFVSLFSGMPRLRVLNLTLALPKGVDRKRLMFWPRGYELRLPWPDLEALTISFPDPEDQIFAHLPPSLRCLSLRCTPHHCLHLWEPSRRFYRHSPILRASEMLDILRRLSAPLLHYLQLEYCADEADEDLLCCITEQFPNIQSLEIHRFLPSYNDGVPVPVVKIAQRLVTLHSLHTIHAYLERPEWMTPSGRRSFKVETLRETAAALGSTLSQSGLALWLLQRVDYGARWRLFRRVIKEGTDQCAPAELELADDGAGIPVPTFR